MFKNIIYIVCKELKESLMKHEKYKYKHTMAAIVKLVGIKKPPIKQSIKILNKLPDFPKYILFTFFGLLSSSLTPRLSQRFGRCTLRPSSDVWYVELNDLFRLPR